MTQNLHRVKNLEMDVGHQELIGSPCLAPNGMLIDDMCCWVLLLHFISFSFINANYNRDT
jgi:hypothetical protein